MLKSQVPIKFYEDDILKCYVKKTPEFNCQKTYSEYMNHLKSKKIKGGGRRGNNSYF